MPEIIVIAHNIRSTHNVGAIFRTCEGFGVSKIILSGYTPTLGLQAIHGSPILLKNSLIRFTKQHLTRKKWFHLNIRKYLI